VKRLWVRFSLAISGFLLLFILLPITYLYLCCDGREQIIPEFINTEGEPYGEELLEAAARITMVVAVIGIGTGVWLSRGLSRPISQLAQAAKRIGSGELGYRVELPSSSQELIDLAAAFNSMSADLQRAEELRSHLMADVSHELRTPLTVLEGNLRAALDHVYELDEAELADLYSQTRHIIGLVNDLRELALFEAHRLPLNMESVDISELVHEVAWNFELMAQEKGVVLTAVPFPTSITLSTDEARLRQVLSNLIVNALQHTPANGRITLQQTTDTHSFTITISDTGSGIAPEHLPHVFDRFYRTDRSRSRETGGTGLGLAIAKAIVEAHNGRLTATSPGSGQGSTFTIQLPLDNGQ
jgi:signal transduction histidine kinase